MTIQEHLLTILAEECAETAQRASKVRELIKTQQNIDNILTEINQQK